MQVRALRCRALRWASVALLSLTAGVASGLVSPRVADGLRVEGSPASQAATEWLSGDDIGDRGVIGVPSRRGPAVERAADGGTRLAALAVGLASATAAGFAARGGSRRVADREPGPGGSVLWGGPVCRRAPPAAGLAA